MENSTTTTTDGNSHKNRFMALYARKIAIVHPRDFPE